MRVLKDNYKKEIKAAAETEPYPRKHICEFCSSELEYEESDLRMGEFGCMHFFCPVCNSDNMLDDNEHNIVLTVDNIEFPTHFHHTSVETGAKDCCNNEEVKNWIRKAIEYFRNNKEDYDYGGHVFGNLYINVHRWSGDEMYEITVSKDFYTMEIPFDTEDY